MFMVVMRMVTRVFNGEHGARRNESRVFLMNGKAACVCNRMHGFMFQAVDTMFCNHHGKMRFAQGMRCLQQVLVRTAQACDGFDGGLNHGELIDRRYQPIAGVHRLTDMGKCAFSIAQCQLVRHRLALCMGKQHSFGVFCEHSCNFDVRGNHF